MITCDKCKAPPIAAAVCDRCGAVYRRCATHGAVAGSRRSLHSHRALAGAACRPPDRQRSADAAGGEPLP